MDYFVELVKALAWPFATVWLGYLFRGELRQLFGRMSKLKYKDMEASFERDLAQAESIAKKMPGVKSAAGYDFLVRTDQLLRIASISPKAAIVEAWSLIEHAAAKAGLTSGSTIQRVNPRMVIEYLRGSGKVSEEGLRLIEELRRLRNQASHLPDFTITSDEAERYLMLASQCASVIEESVSE